MPGKEGQARLDRKASINGDSLFCREHHNFLKLCLKLLSNHLALALAGGVATSILGRQAGPLRNLLFRLMDSSVPDEIQEVSLDWEAPFRLYIC